MHSKSLLINRRNLKREEKEFARNVLDRSLVQQKSKEDYGSKQNRDDRSHCQALFVIRKAISKNEPARSLLPPRKEEKRVVLKGNIKFRLKQTQRSFRKLSIRKALK